jgi:drug/metabolite transporter (DMT)-like permease
MFLLLAFFSAFLNGLSKVLLRQLMKSGCQPLLVLIVSYFGAALLLLMVQEPAHWHHLQPAQWASVLLSIACWSLAGYGDLHAHRHLDVAVNSLFGGLRYVLLVVSGMLLYGDSVGVQGWLGIALIITSLYLVTDLSSLEFRRGSFYRLLAIVGINAGILNDKYLLSFMPTETVVLLALLGPALVFMLSAPRRILLARRELVRSRGLLLVAPILQAVGYLTYVHALALGSVVAVASIGQTTTVFAFILSALLLRERSQLALRAISSLLCITGALLVSRG